MSYFTVNCTCKTRFTNNLKEIIKGEFLGSLCKIIEGSKCHKKPDEYHFFRYVGHFLLFLCTI